jgi:L-lysine 2,3-aminomutase
MPAFDPARVMEPALLSTIQRYSEGDRRIYIMAHFNHPRELTAEAQQSMLALQKANAMTVNQTPLIRGVNDDPSVLSELFEKLSFIGVPPYYVFQCRPTLGNRTFSVPVERAFQIFDEARNRCTAGLAKTARFAMSHESGKVEVVGLSEEHIYLRYQHSPDPANRARFFRCKRNPEAHWLDDYDVTTDGW